MGAQVERRDLHLLPAAKESEAGPVGEPDEFADAARYIHQKATRVLTAYEGLRVAESYEITSEPRRAHLIALERKNLEFALTNLDMARKLLAEELNSRGIAI